MTEVRFGPYKDQFGFQSFKSFIDHVDYYQHVQHIQYGNEIVKFVIDDNGIPVYDIFELQKNEKILLKDTNVVVIETLRQLLSIIDKLDKNKKYIIFSESFWSEQKYQIDLDYNLIYMPWDLVDCQNRLANRSNLYFHLIDLDFFNNYAPKFNFLCLVGRAKPWRDKFVDKLKANLNLETSLVSYYGKNIGNAFLLDLDIPYERTNSKFEFENKFYSPVYISNTDYSYNLSYFTKNELFYNTKFSVVVETESELEEYHITEKTLKCLMLGHPFVVLGTPKYLAYLHSLGFTTFNHLFDESYDNVNDLEDRMDTVIDLIKQLENFDFNLHDLEKIQQKNLLAMIKLRGQETYEKFLGLFDV